MDFLFIVQAKPFFSLTFIGFSLYIFELRSRFSPIKVEGRSLGPWPVLFTRTQPYRNMDVREASARNNDLSVCPFRPFMKGKPPMVSGRRNRNESG